MARYSRKSVLVRQGIMLLSLPTLLAATGYALFSQNLTLTANTRNVSYTSTQFMAVRYTKTTSVQGANRLYSFSPMTVYNRGATTVSAWQVAFDVPAGMTSLTCPASVNCSQVGNRVTIQSNAGATLAAGASVSFNFSFVIAATDYTLENIAVSGTFSTTYQTVAGLTVTVTAGAKSGGRFPLTIVVTNNSGQSISGWQVRIPTTRTCTPTVPAGITFTCTTTLLTYTAAAINIANGGQYTFTSSVSYTPATWNVSGATVRGRG